MDQQRQNKPNINLQNKVTNFANQMKASVNKNKKTANKTEKIMIVSPDLNAEQRKEG